MTVRELRDQLADLPDDAEVMFAYPYGDYWRTEVASKINEVIEGAPVQWSEYHRMHKVVGEPDTTDLEGPAINPGADPNGVKRVVLLS